MNPAFGIEILGHRGARGLVPENTLASFAKALSVGVSSLEIDVGALRDGTIVVIHNSHLEPELTRDASGHWLTAQGSAIIDLDLEELRSFDVGRIKPETSYAARFPEQVPVDGARVPTLSEVLQLTRRSGNDQVRLNIEPKINPTEPHFYLPPDVFVTNILGVLDQEGFRDRATIQSFDWRILSETHRQASEVPTSYLTSRAKWLDTVKHGESGPSPWTADLDIDDFGGSIPRMIKAAGGTIWSPNHRDTTREDVQAAHGLGLRVWVWTVNEKDRMRKFIEMGVDGIITDYPDRLLEIVKEAGLPVPDPTPVSP